MTCQLSNNESAFKRASSRIRQSQGKGRDSNSSSFGERRKLCYQIILKPFIHHLQAHVLIIVKDVTFLNKIEML